MEDIREHFDEESGEPLGGIIDREEKTDVLMGNQRECPDDTPKKGYAMNG